VLRRSVEATPHSDVLAIQNAAPCTNGRFGEAAPQHLKWWPRSALGRSEQDVFLLPSVNVDGAAMLRSGEHSVQHALIIPPRGDLRAAARGVYRVPYGAEGRKRVEQPDGQLAVRSSAAQSSYNKPHCFGRRPPPVRSSHPRQVGGMARTQKRRRAPVDIIDDPRSAGSGFVRPYRRYRAGF
jgi:hypothetical protein